MDKILNAWLDDARTTLLVPSSELTTEDNRRIIALIAALKVGYGLTEKLDHAWGKLHAGEEVRGWVLEAKAEMKSIMEMGQIRKDTR